MNKEIKEIIGLNCEEEIEVKYFAKDDSLAYKTMDYSELLDYITNLQEENEQLKELCNKYEEEHNTTFIEWKKDINIIDELMEDIPHLLDIINRNEKDIKIYQDEWLAISSLEYKLNELKGDNK